MSIRRKIDLERKRRTRNIYMGESKGAASFEEGRDDRLAVLGKEVAPFGHHHRFPLQVDSTAFLCR